MGRFLLSFNTGNDWGFLYSTEPKGVELRLCYSFVSETYRWCYTGVEMTDGRTLRAHSKSKGGCTTCKARRVKCNEARPSCASCLRRGIPCEYISAGRRSAKSGLEKDTSNPSPVSMNPQAASTTPPYPEITDFELEISVESTERRLLEMRLLHQFMARTANKDFLSIHDETVFEIWLETAPILAFEHPFLLNIILSIAALHITKVQPERQDMADIHRAYFNTAISQHRRAVQDLNPANAEAVSLSAILIALPSFILLQNTELTKYSPPLQLFYLLQGNIPLFGSSLALIPKNSKLWSFVSAKPDMIEWQEEVRKDIYQRPFDHLLQWRAPNEDIDPESKRAYEHSLGFIGCILAHIENGSDVIVLRRMLYSFPTLCQPVFIARLKDGNPRALTILAYFFSLVKAADDVWWMRGIAEREVFGIRSILPEPWQWAMSWALQKLAFYASQVTPPKIV